MNTLIVIINIQDGGNQRKFKYNVPEVCQNRWDQSKMSCHVELLSSGIVQPLPKPVTQKSTDLSITDSLAASVPPTGTIWYYDRPSSGEALSFESLTVALQKTLAYYDHFCGKFSWIPYQDGQGHRHRQGRLSIEYGSEQDAGVQILTAKCDATLASVVPTPAQRGSVWSTDEVPSEKFIPMHLKLALADGRTTDSGPNVIVQLTQFACGGMAIGLRTVHALTDGQTLFTFVHDWARIHDAYVNGKEEPKITARYEPRKLDNVARGDINAEKPDEEILKESQRLPIHRYDWLASSEDAPDAVKTLTQTPAELQSIALPAPGLAIPWTACDFSAATSHYRIRFTSQEIDKMLKMAKLSMEDKSLKISRLDAIQAHIWNLVNRARGLTGDKDPVYFTYCFNMRGRIGLDNDFMGNPMILAYATLPGDHSTEPELGKLVSSIRSSVQALDGPGLTSYLHELSHQTWLQRYCQWAMGRRHLTATSWMFQRSQRVNFGAGTPRYMSPALPDYFLVVLEGPDAENGYEDGVEVIVTLEADVVDKMLKDPLLRAYEEKLSISDSSEEELVKPEADLVTVTGITPQAPPPKRGFKGLVHRMKPHPMKWARSLRATPHYA